VIVAVQRLLLFSIVFFNISQLGKHFWPYFAYVSGIRVDYLSPTLYFTDILIFLLFLTTLPFIFFSFRTLYRPPFSILIVIFFLSVSIIISKYDMSALYGAIKVLEMIFLGYLVSRRFFEKDLCFVEFLLSGAVVIEGILIILQMMSQSSVGGVWYLLGERTFTVGNIGISTVTIFGEELLRAYGSFPHPNVTACFFLVSILFLISSLSHITGSWKRRWLQVVLVIATLSLLSTFSRIVIFLLLVSIAYLFLKKVISKKVALLLGGSVLFFVLIFFQRFGVSALFSEDIMWRINLLKIAWEIIQQHFIFGVGLHNYFYYQIDYQRSITPVLLQPPHNIYVLFLLQVGFLGFIAVLYFIIKTMRRALYAARLHPLSLRGTASLLFLSFLLIGVADHYLVTLQQGMILTAIITGMVWIPKEQG